MGCSFDMVSPTVVTEVGGKLGNVEDVERRRNPNDQNFFMRVKVALPIPKPLRRGAYLASADGERTWCKFKYERLPLFYHYYGMLGHDLWHCAKHFVATKHNGDVKCQYGDWMKASGGHSRTPPKGPLRLTRKGGKAQGGGGRNSKQVEPIKAVFKKQDGNPKEEGGFGCSEKSGIHFEGH